MLRQIPVLVFALLAPIGLSTAVAHAETDVEALIAKGIEARKGKNDREALRLFREAYAISPTPRLRAQIALAEQALGKWIEAETDLHGALEAASDPWVKKNEAVLRADLAEIEEHLGWVEISGPIEASVRINGTLVGKLPLPAPVRVVAGTVHIEVIAPAATVERDVDVAPKEKRAETIQPPKPTAAGVAAEKPTLDTHPGDKVEPVERDRPLPASVTLMRWSGVALAAVGTFTVIATYVRDDGSGSSRAFNTMGWIGLGVGAAAFTTSFLLDPSLSAPKPSTGVSWGIGPGSFHLHGTF